MIYAWLSARWESLLKYAAILGGVLLVLARVKRSGKIEERNDHNEKVVEQVKRSRQIDNEVDTMPSDDKRQWLRDNASRDK